MISNHKWWIIDKIYKEFIFSIYAESGASWLLDIESLMENIEGDVEEFLEKVILVKYSNIKLSNKNIDSLAESVVPKII